MGQKWVVKLLLWVVSFAAQARKVGFARLMLDLLPIGLIYYLLRLAVLNVGVNLWPPKIMPHSRIVCSRSHQCSRALLDENIIDIVEHR